jgi:hypothetical protein
VSKGKEIVSAQEGGRVLRKSSQLLNLHQDTGMEHVCKIISVFGMLRLVHGVDPGWRRKDSTNLMRVTGKATPLSMHAT